MSKLLKRILVSKTARNMTLMTVVGLAMTSTNGVWN